jgi:hypothetical protein
MPKLFQNVVNIEHLDVLVTDGSSRRGSGPPGASALRSNSAIDLQAAQRAKARAQYAALARHKVGSGASLRKF